MSQYLVLLQIKRDERKADLYESLALEHAGSAATAVDQAFERWTEHVAEVGHILASKTPDPCFKFIAIGVQSKRASIQTRNAPVQVAA